MNEQGLTAQQRRWVEQAAPRVPRLAARMIRRLPGVSEDDLVSVGYEALTLAARRYDPETGVPFAGFAHQRVRGAMIDAARQADPAARRHARALRSLEVTQGLLEDAADGDGSGTAHDQRSLRDRVEAAARLVDRAAAAVMLVRSQTVEPDAVAGSIPDAEGSMDQQRLADRVRQALAGCTEAERGLVDGLYTRGLTMGEYAAEIGKTKSTVSRQHGRLIARLAEALRHGPPDPPDS